MTARNAVAAELQAMLEQLTVLTCRAEALARSSAIVDWRLFGGARSAFILAAGQLDQQGLLQTTPEPEKAAA